MTTLVLSDYLRDLATPRPERKWVLRNGEWIKVQMIRIREGNGWVEIPAQEARK